jgi:hypothetical protein
LNGPLKSPQVEIGVTPVIVGIGILWVEADGLIEVLNGSLNVAQLLISKTLVLVGNDILGVELDGLIILISRHTISALVVKLDTLIGVPLSILD